MATHSSALAWRIPGTVEPGGLPSVGLHRVGHNWSDLAAAAAISLGMGWVWSIMRQDPVVETRPFSETQAHVGLALVVNRTTSPSLCPSWGQPPVGHGVPGRGTGHSRISSPRESGWRGTAMRRGAEGPRRSQPVWKVASLLPTPDVWAQGLPWKLTSDWNLGWETTVPSCGERGCKYTKADNRRCHGFNAFIVS